MYFHPHYQTKHFLINGRLLFMIDTANVDTVSFTYLRDGLQTLKQVDANSILRISDTNCSDLHSLRNKHNIFANYRDIV